ncbi:MAG: signal peptidase I [Minisyncoccales bacterium]
MKKNFLNFLLETLKSLILAGIIVLPIRLFIFQPFLVQGASMAPHFSTGDYLIVDEISFRFREPRRGEVIVFKYPVHPSQKFIKRVIGLPGETVEVKDGNIFINGKILKEDYLNNVLTFPTAKISLGPDEYFVLGDNRDSSLDSRVFGPLKRKYLVGRVLIKVFSWKVIPLPALEIIKVPSFNFNEQN